jgi:hypothetical protein
VPERGRRSPTFYDGGHRYLDREKVPDAFAWQLLTGQHLNAAHDLSGWSVTDVAPDRFAVAHPDPDAWFLPNQDNLGSSHPDSDVLARARQDFGAMILREDPEAPRS